MQDFTSEEVYKTAKKWVLQAGEMIRDSIDDQLVVNTKSNPNDLVTAMDKKIEKFFVGKIREHYPSDRILSEEGFGDKLADLAGVVWMIDPIDGTMNFVHQKRNFAISVAIYRDGIGEIAFVYNVMEDVLYSAIRGEGAYKNDTRLPHLKADVKLTESILILNSTWSAENKHVNEKKIQQLTRKVRGTRAYGSAALEFSYVAEGIVDGYLSMQLYPWDFAAGVILVNEVGGITTQANGKPLNFLTRNSIYTGNQQIKEEIVNHYIELK